MAEKQEHIAERAARQNLIDEKWIAPVWEKTVDIPMLELCCARNTVKSPVVLLPELRFKSFLSKLIECLPNAGKLMIVDNTNTRFESLRRCAQNSPLNLYFSTQEVSALNYADNIFHIVMTQVGLATACRAEVVFAAYRRVLKPGGRLICSMPHLGSFTAFFDILDECLFKLHPTHGKEIMDDLVQSLSPKACAQAITNSGLTIEACETSSFELSLPNVEQLLFASLVESHYLSYCLTLREPKLDSKELLTHIVRSFHHYFQGASLRVPMKLGIYSAVKPEIAPSL